MIKNTYNNISKVKRKKKTNLFIPLFLGLIVGAMNGFLGGGGGMIVVPLLNFICGLEDKKAHATAILIILPLCAVSAITYSAMGIFDWDLTLWCGIGAITGGILGAIFLKKMSNKTVRIIFSILMIVAGIKMVL